MPLCSVCPGEHIAQSTLFILAAHMLSVFTIKPVTGENGTIKELPLDWPEQIVWYDLPITR